MRRSASSKASLATRGRSTTSCSSAASSKSGCGRSNRASVVLRVLARVAAHALDRILALVVRDLVVGRAQEIDVEPVCQAQQIDEHIGELEPHALAALGIERPALLLGQPLE